MKPFETTATVDADGTIHVRGRAPIEFRNGAIGVRLLPLDMTAEKLARDMTNEEWRSFLSRMAGRLDDPTFVLPERLPWAEKNLFG